MWMKTGKVMQWEAIYGEDEKTNKRGEKQQPTPRSIKAKAKARKRNRFSAKLTANDNDEAKQ